MAYFDVEPWLIKYNCDVYIFLGARRLGKTYSAKQLACNDKENEGFNSFWISRFQSHAKNRKDSFLYKFHRDNWTQKGTKHIKYNDEISVYNISLTQDESIKGVEFPRIKNFIFDEFITNGIYYKGEQEPEVLHNIIFTASDYTNSFKQRLILLANSVSKDNPYFRYYGINELPLPSKFKIFTVNKKGVKLKIFVMVIKMDMELKEQAQESLAYKLSALNEDYYNYAIENEFSFDNDTMISFKPRKLKHLHNVIIRDKIIGVWKCENSILWFSNETPHTKYLYPLTWEDALSNKMFFQEIDYLINFYKNKLSYNKMRFQDYTIRELIIQWLARN